MIRNLILTEDGSHTIFIPEMGEHYHSIHGAIQESRHVYIKNGYDSIHSDSVSILEIGFGTGLNAFLTLLATTSDHKSVHYESWEAFPLSPVESALLNYPDILNSGHDLFKSLHDAAWGIDVPITSRFILKKVHNDILNFYSDRIFDLVYFDAFGPDFQPGLWEYRVFLKIYNQMRSSSVLTTYSAKGQVRRNLRQAGFEIIKRPGPPGKREITMAIKKTETP